MGDGCDQTTADRAIKGDIALVRSDRDYDWLGPGAYFWESDPQRAREWANEKVARGDFKTASVIGAVIDLRHCLDLVTREDVDLLAAAHRSFVKLQKRANLPIPKNRSVKGQPDADRILRFLDCAVFRHLHQILDAQSANEQVIAPFDTVRGMFTEGGRLYAGCGFRKRSHVQIAVRNDACIRGVFIPR